MRRIVGLAAMFVSACNRGWWTLVPVLTMLLFCQCQRYGIASDGASTLTAQSRAEVDIVAHDDVSVRAQLCNTTGQSIFVRYERLSKSTRDHIVVARVITVGPSGERSDCGEMFDAVPDWEALEPGKCLEFTVYFSCIDTAEKHLVISYLLRRDQQVDADDGSVVTIEKAFGHSN